MLKLWGRNCLRLSSTVSTIPAAPTAPSLTLTPRLMDLKIGKIIDIKRHENADKLYVSQVQISQDGKTLQVCSGLVGLVPIEALLNRRIVLITNLKPSKMRGVKSEAMLLAAEKIFTDKSIKVEPIDPPSECNTVLGQKLEWKNLDSTIEESKRIKNKVWDELAKGLKTNDIGEVIWSDNSNNDYALGVRVGDHDWESCTMKNFKNCNVR